MADLANTRTIQLSRGKVAVVDAADYEWLNQWKWQARPKHYTWHAWRTANDGGIKSVSMHRAILGLTNGDGVIVDHRDRDGLNNTRANLRICTRSQNGFNSLRRPPTSGYRGVCWAKSERKWQAVVKERGVNRFLGYFSTAEEAAAAYDAAIVEIAGEFAVTNDVLRRFHGIAVEL